MAIETQKDIKLTVNEERAKKLGITIPDALRKDMKIKEEILMLDLVVGTITTGLLWSLLAVGVFITFRVLDVADLTVEGTFPMGAPFPPS